MKLIKAKPNNLNHCFKLYSLYNENIEYFFTNIKPSFLSHYNWYKNIFNKEYIYLIKVKEIIGYIRINKQTKEISIALESNYQNKGLGNQAIKLLKIKRLIAKVKKDNYKAIYFFNKLNIKTIIV